MGCTAVYPVDPGIYEETLAALRSTLGEASFEKLWARGLECDRDELLVEVLAGLD